MSRPPSIHQLLVTLTLSLLCIVAPSRAQIPAPTNALPIGAEERKEKELRGPAPEEKYLSSLSPAARAQAGFENVEESDENPFGMVSAALDDMVPSRPVSEEQRIRGVLSNLRVSGLIGSRGAYRVLLGPLWLGEGDILPRLLANQAEQLKVRSISDRGVLLEFVEEEQRESGARTVGLPFDLRARADSLLIGEVFLKMVPLDRDGSAQLPSLALPSVETILNSARDQNLQSIVERSTEMMNAPAMKETDEKPLQ